MKQRTLFRDHWPHWVGAGLVWALLSQAACAPARSPARPAAVPQPPAMAREATPPREALPGLIVTEVEGKREPERLYTLSLRGADIREVLMALGKQTSFNIVVDPKVKGAVTVDLKNVTLTEALDTLTGLVEVTYSIKQNIIRVSEPVPETRIFSLQYVNLKRTGSSSTSAQIGAGGGGGAAARATGETSVTTTTETDLWKDIEAGVAKLLSPAGKMLVDKQGSHLLITDLPKFLDRIASFLEKIEGSVQRQVLIEARILEVTLTGDYRFGLDWGAIAKASALRGATTISPSRIIGQRLAPSGAFQVGVTSTDFAALLSVLSTQGEVNVLSSPKLATLNNQTALIRAATDDVFFERRVTIIPIAGAAPQTVVETIPRTITVGVVLSITPQIGPDGGVVLHIRPTVTERTGERKSPEGDIFPILDVREADMVVRAREGQFIIIGGLIQEKKSDDESKIPLLGDIPGVGRLFRSTTQERRKTELVVLLSPTVLVGKKVDEVTTRELERLNKTRGRSLW